MIERIVRTAHSFEEAAEIDRQDVAAMSIEERISGVERLRRVWFIEDRAESRLDRVLVCADLPSGKDLRDVALLEEHASLQATKPKKHAKPKKPTKPRRGTT
jgi:hypothetical protein